MAAKHGLFVSGASAGVTSPREARLALASLLTGVGVISGCAVSGSSSGPNMQYNVTAGSVVTARGTASTDGLYLWASDGTVLVNSATPAPSSGTRWDLVWARAKNAFTSDGFGDANSDPEFGVTVGTAGSTPTKPYASVPAGALVLAECSVGTNIANAAAATITQVAPVASGASGVRRVTGVSQYPAAPVVGTYIDDATLGLLRWDGDSWNLVGGADTGWVPLTLASGIIAANSTTPAVRLKGGKVFYSGHVGPSGGGSFAAAALITVVTAVPAQFRSSLGIGATEAQLAGNAAANSVRAYVDNTGLMQFITGTASPSYVCLPGLSGYIAE